jgi:lysyl-tRNA synthetase class 1
MKNDENIPSARSFGVQGSPLPQHWSERLAREVLKNHPNLKLYTVASGITPSGSVHIGNYREFVTNYMVGVALKKLGKPVRMIFSWDDFDRLRKVPKNITVEGFEKYIGLPVSSVPDPFGQASSYAKYFEHEFEQSMRQMRVDEIPLEFKYQNKEYKSGRYNEHIIHAIKQRERIYDIITSFKTQGGEEGEKKTYYPITVYCPKCGKDNTTVISFDAKTDVLTFKCKCSDEIQTVDVKKANNIKLVWKVDWPMRWKAEGTVFEAAGPDHLADGGSYTVASKIAKEIFGIMPPNTQMYGFVGIKGVGVKMSSSKGTNITPETLLNIYEPEIINWLFAKYAPQDFFEFGFDDTIVRHYAEYDRENLHKYTEKGSTPPSFGTLTTVAPIVNFNEELVRKMLDLGDDVDLSRVARVKFWLENFAPDKIYKLRKEFNAEFYKTLGAKEKETIKKLCDYLAEFRREEEIQQFLYSIINDPALDKKENIENQKRYFKIFYNMLFGRDDGPRLYLYLALCREDCRALLSAK